MDASLPTGKENRSAEMKQPLINQENAKRNGGSSDGYGIKGFCSIKHFSFTRQTKGSVFARLRRYR